MNSPMNLTIAALLTALIGIPQAYAQADPVDRAHSKANKSRTWEVYSTQALGGHLAVGDKFKVMKAGPNTVFIPMFNLRTRWAKAAGYSVALVKTTGATKKLCGEVEVPNHGGLAHGPKHLIVISPLSNDDISIETFLRDVNETIADDCENAAIHGGMAHAQD